MNFGESVDKETERLRGLRHCGDLRKGSFFPERTAHILRVSCTSQDRDVREKRISCRGRPRLLKPESLAPQ
jgi:hypothetical protein